MAIMDLSKAEMKLIKHHAKQRRISWEEVLRRAIGVYHWVSTNSPRQGARVAVSKADGTVLSILDMGR